MIYRMRADDIHPYNCMDFYFQVSHYFVSDCPVILCTLYSVLCTLIFILYSCWEKLIRFRSYGVTW